MSETLLTNVDMDALKAVADATETNVTNYTESNTSNYADEENYNTDADNYTYELENIKFEKFQTYWSLKVDAADAKKTIAELDKSINDTFKIDLDITKVDTSLGLFEANQAKVHTEMERGQRLMELFQQYQDKGTTDAGTNIKSYFFAFSQKIFASGSNDLGNI